MRREFSEEQLAEVTSFSLEEIEEFRKDGIPFIEQNGNFFYPSSAIDWILENHKIFKVTDKGNTLLDAYQRGLNPHGV